MKLRTSRRHRSAHIVHETGPRGLAELLERVYPYVRKNASPSVRFPRTHEKSGRWGSNPQQPAWKAGTLPIELRPRQIADCGLRIAVHGIGAVAPLTEAIGLGMKSAICNPHSSVKWGVRDSNPRRQCQQIYSLPPLAAWVTPRSWERDLHPQPPVYKTGALLLSYPSRCA